MALTYGFYNSSNGDRKYDAVQMSSIFDGIFKDGIFKTLGTAMQVIPGSGMMVLIGEGRAWFNHTWTLNDAPYPISIDASSVLLNRIDTIVLEVDSRDISRRNGFYVIKGTPASSPVPPTLIRSIDRNQYPLCDIRVNANVSSIVAGNITSRIGTVDCPYIMGILSGELEVIDDLNSTDPGAALSANQGRILNNKATPIDNLTSTSTTQSLSANQGRILNTGKAPNNHATNQTTYGVANASYYGHAMASGLTPAANSSSGNVGNDNGKYAREGHYHPAHSGMFNGYTYANNSYTSQYTTQQVRNSILANYGPSGGGYGDLWFQYT